MSTVSNLQNVVQLNNPIAELKSIREALKTLEAQEKALKDQINNILDSNGVEELVIGSDKIKRQLTERASFDSTGFKSIHPALYAEFTKKTAVITLRTL